MPDDDVVAYYRKHTEDGVGPVITEGSPPHPTSAFGADVPRLHGEDALAGWARVSKMRPFEKWMLDAL